MKRSLLIALGPVFLAAMAWAFSGGPPDGRTGAPLESNCTVSCHSSFVLNSGNGGLSINTPSTYLPGDTIDISIALNDPGQQRWGFEVTVLDGNDQPAGELLVTEVTRTQKSTVPSGTLIGREYIKHQSAGTDNGTPDVAPGWSLKWIANDGVTGTVTFYAAGNAANGNFFNTGDYIYTTSTTVDQEFVTCCTELTGNVDNDVEGLVDIGDLTALIAFLFIPPNLEPVCIETANIDGDVEGLVDIGDLTALIAFLFIPPNPEPAACQ
jgi:hypothetical protein